MNISYSFRAFSTVGLVDCLSECFIEKCLLKCGKEMMITEMCSDRRRCLYVKYKTWMSLQQSFVLHKNTGRIFCGEIHISYWDY